MADSNLFGKMAEDMAVHYLQKQGYEILCRNYRYRRAEIDIIILKEEILAIVEVKARSYSYYGEPESFINDKKRRLLTEAAHHFITYNNMSYQTRFDVISIKRKRGEFVFRHIKDAFPPL